MYKQRLEILVLFDFLKNLFLQDMVCEVSLGSWVFIDHLVLMMMCWVYDLLRRHKLLSRVSVEDFFVI